MFWLQLRQLMWKNFLIRKRSKIRVATELVWPLILFVILALVRTKGLKDYKTECFLEEKALPSAGSLIFLRSLVCTFGNQCHDSPPSVDILSEEFKFEDVSTLMHDLKNIATKRITDEELVKGSGVVADVTAGVALAFKLLNDNSSRISLPLKSIINRDVFHQLYRSKNASQLDLSTVLGSTLKVPTMNILRSQLENPREIFCNTSILKSWIETSNKSLNTLSQVLCTSSSAEALALINSTLLVQQIQHLLEKQMDQPLHLEDWKSLGSLFNAVILDIRDLNSLSDIFKKFTNTTLGRLVEHFWKFKDDSTRNKTSLTSFFNSTSDILCGKNAMIKKKESMEFPDGPQNNEFRRRLFKSRTVNVSRPDDVLPAVCDQLIFDLQQNPITRVILDLFYPFIRGKLVYAPNFPAFDPVIQEVNQTFQELKKVQDLSNMWLNEISPSIKRFLDRLDPEIIDNITGNINPPNLDMATTLMTNASELINKIREALVKIDLAANLVNTYVDCYEFDKFEGFASEEEAVARGMNLIENGRLWAVIVFRGNEPDVSNGVLPRNITYKLRMDSSKIDSTKRLRDFFEIPAPRINPTTEMKYFTSGYIFLQDKIEHAIIKLHSNRTTLPGMFMQQFPSPCYTYDTFFMALAGLFPLFMILSFVYTCAMIVKSIVREKERRLKETMKTMGLGNTVHWIAWFIDSMSFMLISCLLLSMILVFGRVLENSNFLLVFIFVLSFSVATVCFSFLVSTFFSRANLAAACGGFAFFACFLPYNFLNLNNQDYSLSTLVLASLLSDVSFGIGCWYFASFEQSGVGAQWNNFATSPKDGDAYSLLGCILMMLFDSVLYLILTWYIETVFPGQYGIPKPWYFMFQPSYWCSSKPNKSAVSVLETCTETGNAELVEEESRNLMAGVSIRNLGKTYSNGKVALRNLNIDFYEDQITSFLGHNGAGKTTTISILTGLFPPSVGTAKINGLDIRYQMDSIRHQLGVCPQHNVLFDQLTVEEHLRFYANLKTGERIESQKEIDKMIEDLGLAHKRHDFSTHLSGGMKRKLSIGAAFIGNSKTVILDEPTAGVDPYSRRSIWDILLKYKAGRTIILTTHFMDEADLLGDRIAIISQGQLKCCGSSLFLKQKLGSGYYLTVVRKDGEGNNDTRERTAGGQVGDTPVETGTAENGTEQIASVVKRYIPNGNIVQDVGSDLVFCLPEFDEGGQRQRDKFPSLFDDLDLNMDRLGLDSYGVSDTTLEEIFLRVADDPSAETNLPNTQRLELNNLEEEGQPREESGSDTFNLESSEKLTGKRLIFQQMKALYIKRICNSKRNWKGFFCEIILPCVLVVIGELFSLTLNLGTPLPELVLSPWLYGDVNEVFYANHNPGINWTNEYINNMIYETGMGVRCLDGEPLPGLNCSSSDIGLLNPSVNPDDYREIHCPCDSGVPSCPANNSQGELLRYRSVTSDEFYDLSGRNISTWILRTFDELKEKRFGGFEFGIHNMSRFADFTQQFANDESSIPFRNILSKPDILSASSNSKGITDDLTKNNVKVWFENKAWASSVSYLNAINNVIMRSSLPKSKDAMKYGITVINHPMEYSSKQTVDTEQVAVSLAFALTVMFSLSFVPASFVIFLVEERVSKAKHLQFISGVKPTTFWIASYTWDLVNYMVPCFLIILIFVAFGQWEYVGKTSIGGMILLLLLFGISAIPLMYPTSFVFSVPSTAFVGLACANLFIGVVTTVSSYVLQLFDDEELVAVGEVLDQVFLIFPHFCLGRGLMDLAETYFTAKNFELIGIAYSRNIFEWDYLGRYFVSFIVQAIIFFSFNLMLHYPIWAKLTSGYRKTVLVAMGPEDEDVARERARVEQNDTLTDELLLKRLTKVYNGQKSPATDRLSFGLKRGECFGLLGVNGAGKSTTFKMLTGDEIVTSGNAFVGGYNILTELSKAQQNLGYCPQEDALLPLMTGVEHLELFARLRGVPKRYIDKLVDDGLKKLSLIPYKDRCAGTYSGGNKRKLSTAIAFVGNPAVVFLDEPSSGMDPRARRSLWQAVIDAVNDSRSVLLTSHSMEECQVLCTRLAIMVNGTLRCLGSSQHLKNRFGNGYMINVRCEIETMGDVLQSVQSLIPEARLRERRSRQLIWHVQPNLLQISALFQRMERARAATPMVDYSITQTTLDDVFVRFARLQRENFDDVASEDPDFDASSFHSGTINSSVTTDDDRFTEF